MTRKSRSPALGSAEPLHRVYIEVGHTDQAGRTQVSELLFSWEELSQISSWLLSTLFLFRAYVLYVMETEQPCFLIKNTFSIPLTSANAH
jgi:hypothetical protein